MCKCNKATDQQRDASLDSSKRAGLIIGIALAAIAAAWFLTIKLTSKSPYHQ